MIVTDGARRALRRARRVMRRAMARYPAVYLPWVRTRRKAFDGSDKAVTPETEIVIEGFPRSGNSFAFAAFRQAQPRPIRIAHHLHAPAQVIAGVRGGIPTLVVIRPPDDAVVSLMVRQPGLSPDDALRDYIAFYKPLVGYGAGLLVADFAEVTTDFGNVVRKLNSKFGTRFTEFEHSPENVERCFGVVEEIHRSVRAGDPDFEAGVARPSADRERRKHEARRLLSQERLEKLRAEASGIYETFRRLAEREP